MTKYAKGATINDDFTDAVSDVRFWTIRRRLWFALNQETKNTNLHRKFRGDKFFVHQARNNAAKAGVSIVVDRTRFAALGTGIHLMSKGGGLMARYVIWVDVEEHESGMRRRLLTWHRAPLRARHLWPRQDAVVAAVINNSPYPVWAGTDSNQEGGPDALIAKLHRKYRWKGQGIDGFIVPVSAVANGFKSWRLRMRKSDHHAYMGRFPID